MIDFSILLHLARTNPVKGDLSTLKIAVSLLPDILPATREACHLLDNIDAIIFHIIGPMRDRSAEDWLDKHYVNYKGEVKMSAEDKERGMEILSLLGITQPPPILKRL